MTLIASSSRDDNNNMEDIIGSGTPYSNEELREAYYKFLTSSSVTSMTTATTQNDDTTNSNDNNSKNYNNTNTDNENNINENNINDIDYNNRHILGYNRLYDKFCRTSDTEAEEIKLSMLQTITATIILDYEKTSSKEKKNMITTEDCIDTKIRTIFNIYGPILNVQYHIQQCQPKMALASEYKRASPSKGLIVHDDTTTTIEDHVTKYIVANTDIISVLTEPRWFHGTLNDLVRVRKQCSIVTTQSNNDNKSLVISSPATTTNPNRTIAILRKDFIMNEDMIDDAVCSGADTVLLIVAILPQNILHRLIQYCRTRYNRFSTTTTDTTDTHTNINNNNNIVCTMEPLVEVHTDLELDIAIQAGARLIGINNRNLHTFQLDMTTSERIATRLKQYEQKQKQQQQQQENDVDVDNTNNNNNNNNSYYTLCALSGMSTCYDVDRYRTVGIQMCLIGESLMRSNDPISAIQSLCLHPNDYKKVRNEQQQDQEQSINLIMSTPAAAGTNTTLTTSGSYIRSTQLIKICGITNVHDAIVACQAGANIIGIIFANSSKRKIQTIQQGKDIVSAVRAYGERTNRLQFIGFHSNSTNNNKNKNKNKNNNNTNSSSTNNTLVQLIGNSRILMQTIRTTPAVVGVFQNQDSTYIEQIVNECGLDLVQLHGSEGMIAANPIYCGNVPAIRVIDIPTEIVSTTTTTTTAPSSPSNNTTGTDQKEPHIVQTILQSLTSDPIAILLDTSIKGSTGGQGGTGMSFDWKIVTKIQNSGLPIIVAGGLSPDTIKDCIIQIKPFGIDVSSGVEQKPGIKDHDKVRQFIHTARAAAIESNQGF